MNFYIFTYQIWHTTESTTSDGFPDRQSDWKEEKRYLEAVSDEDARKQAFKLLDEVTQVAPKLKIQLPVLTRVVALPTIDGIKTYKDIEPWWEGSRYYQE